MHANISTAIDNQIIIEQNSSTYKTQGTAEKPFEMERLGDELHRNSQDSIGSKGRSVHSNEINPMNQGDSKLGHIQIKDDQSKQILEMQNDGLNMAQLNQDGEVETFYQGFPQEYMVVGGDEMQEIIAHSDEITDMQLEDNFRKLEERLNQHYTLNIMNQNLSP